MATSEPESIVYSSLWDSGIHLHLSALKFNILLYKWVPLPRTEHMTSKSDSFQDHNFLFHTGNLNNATIL